jgi:hypothetical protein
VYGKEKIIISLYCPSPMLSSLLSLYYVKKFNNIYIFVRPILLWVKPSFERKAVTIKRKSPTAATKERKKKGKAADVRFDFKLDPSRSRASLAFNNEYNC